MSPTPTPVGPPAQLGQFSLVRLLGEGSMGRVFEARHALLDRTVAIKVLRPEQVNDPELVRRFFQEARTVNRINHPHIVEIQDFVEDRDEDGRPRAWCVMEYLDGETLSTLLRREPQPLARTLRIADQVARALAAAHGVGVIHRDIKPDNVLIARGPDGRDFAKVLDFGVAKLVQPDPLFDLGKTRDGAIIGTPRYMSPEQAASLEVDARTDIWGLGCLLYEMLSGHPPFDGDSFGQLAARILTQPPAPLDGRTSAGERLHPELEGLVLQCLEKDPALRPQSLEEVRARLAVPGAEPMLPQRSFPLALVASAALVLLGLGALALRSPVRASEEVDAPAPSIVMQSLPLSGAPGTAPPRPEAEVVPAAEVTRAPFELSADPAPAEDKDARLSPGRKFPLRSRQPGAGRHSESGRESRDAVLNPFPR